MRRSRLALSTSLAAIGLSASIALAQQSSRASASGAAASPSDNSTIDPSMASRPTRYLLRNGLDYLAYHEYGRALNFFRAVEARQGELNETELKQLKAGIAKAQQGLREAVNATKGVAQSKGRPTVQPGAFALAKPASTAASRTATASKAGSAPTDPLLLASAEMPDPPPISPAALPILPPPTPSVDPAPEPAQMPVASDPRPVFGVSANPNRYRPAPQPPAEEAQPRPAPAPVELPPSLPPPGSDAIEPPQAQPAPLEPSSPSPSPAPVDLPPVMPSSVELPPSVSPPVPMTPDSIPPSAEPVSPEPVQPRAVVAHGADDPRPSSPPRPAPEPPPAAEAPPSRPSLGAIPSEEELRSATDRILSPRLTREVEMIAQRGTNPDANRPGTATDPMEAPPPTQGSPRLEIPRAPSPTEARPLRSIAVPEEFVPLGKREWNPNRKHWAAAGTCHMILYFQDPALERYGQSAEQALGPLGRYFSYPLDDPKQSNQRNQILQPFYSMGKLCFQVGTLPYKLVVDPPWEAEYDLGYYRPGDRIPPDTIVITPYGVGPPLRGRQY